MSPEMVEAATVVGVANASAVILLVPMAMVGGALALNGLERFDGWLRRRDHERRARSGEAVREERFSS